MRSRLFAKRPSYNFTLSHECRNCGHHFTGRFCNICGEKVIEAEDKSLRNFLGSVFNAFTFVDSKLVYTLRMMIMRPGYVTSHYIQGQRVPFVKPISLFFLVNLIYFLFPAVDTFNSKLNTQTNLLPHSKLATALVEKKIAKENITIETFTLQYEQQSTNMGKLLVVVFVMMAAVVIALLNLSRKFYFVDHVTTSLEFNSTAILIFLVLIPWLIIFLARALHLLNIDVSFLLSDKYYSRGIALCLGFVFYKMERRVYEQKIVWAILKAVAFVALLFYVLEVYRMMLFFVTMWTI